MANPPHRRFFGSLRALPAIETSARYDRLVAPQIRLVTITPGAKHFPVRCTLKTVSLSDPVLQYVALSWTWGAPDNKHVTITLNDQPHSIKPSLHDALVALRHQDEPQTFWIDAICINQKDDDEKSHQIPLMTAIYKQADFVVIWVGREYEDSEYFIDCLRQNRSDAYESDRFLIAMVRFIQRPWFSRTWVLQEFALHEKSPQLVCGFGPSVEWQLFDRAMAAVKNTFATLSWTGIAESGKVTPEAEQRATMLAQLGVQGLSNAYYLMDMRLDYQTHENSSFPAILYVSRFLQCSDPRDKTYGILGLLDAHVRSQFLSENPANYTISAMQVYHQTMTFLLDRNIIHVSLFLGFQSASQRDASLPSWVLDFNNPYPNTYYMMEPTYGKLLMCAVSSDKLSLPVMGVELDEVAHTVTFNHLVDNYLQQTLTLKMYPLYIFFGIVFSVQWVAGKILSLHLRAKMATMNFLFGRELFFNLYQIDCLMKNITSSTGLTEPLWKTLLTTMTSHQIWRDIETSPHYDVERLYNSLMSFASRSGWLRVLQVEKEIRENPLHGYLSVNLGARRFFTGTKGWYGVSQGSVCKQDRLVLLFPEQYAPFILRPVGEKFRLVGVAYVPPKMRQEVLTCAETRFTQFTIV